MGGRVEMLGFEEFGNPLEGPVVEQYGAEQALLGLLVERQLSGFGPIAGRRTDGGEDKGGIAFRHPSTLAE